MPKKVERPGESRYVPLPPPAKRLNKACPHCGGERTYLGDERIRDEDPNGKMSVYTIHVCVCLDCWGKF